MRGGEFFPPPLQRRYNMKSGRRLIYIGILALAAAVLLTVILRPSEKAGSKAPTLTIETPQMLDSKTRDDIVLDVSVSGMGDALYPAASLSIRFDPSRLEFLGIGEGNVFVRDPVTGQNLPDWSCSVEQSNKTGLINIMYLDMTAGQHAFDKELLAPEDNVLLRLSFRLRGSVRAGDVLDLTVEDAVFAASDETQSLATTKDTLQVKNSRIVIGG